MSSEGKYTMTDAKRTVVAQAALDTSALLNMRFAPRLVGTQTKRRLTIAVPDGPSTDGGKKSRQSIVLVPAEDASAGTVMCGWLDVAQRRAELRVHGVVEAQYVARYKHEFDVPKDAYDGLLRDFKSTLEMQQIEVAIIDSVPAGLEGDSRATMAPVASPAGAKGVSIALYLAAFALFVGLAVAAYLVLG